MPTYDYVCDACGHALEIFHSMSEPPKKKCPACGKSKLARQIGAGAGFLFKGQGFYKTDYRSDSYKAGEKAENAPAASTDAKPAGASDKASESKPTEAKPAEKKTAEAKPSTKSETKVKPKKRE